jgi:hypothetical protein
MNPEVLAVLISLTALVIQEAQRAKMTNDEIKAQLGIDVEEFNLKNPDVIPDFPDAGI